MNNVRALSDSVDIDLRRLFNALSAPARAINNRRLRPNTATGVR